MPKHGCRQLTRKRTVTVAAVARGASWAVAVTQAITSMMWLEAQGWQLRSRKRSRKRIVTIATVARGASWCSVLLWCKYNSMRDFRCLYSSVVERQSCKLKVLGSIPSGGYLLGKTATTANEHTGCSGTIAKLPVLLAYVRM